MIRKLIKASISRICLDDDAHSSRLACLVLCTTLALQSCSDASLGPTTNTFVDAHNSDWATWDKNGRKMNPFMSSYDLADVKKTVG